jgi:hypothetical protein
MAVIFGSILVNNLWAQTGTNEISKNQDFENRIFELEKKYDSQMSWLTKSEELLKQDFQNKKTELTNSFHELKNEQTEKIFNELIKPLQAWWYFLSIIVALLFGGGIVAYFIKLFKEQIIIKTLATKFGIEAENMAELLKEVKTDYTLKKNTKILVATPAKQDDLFIRIFFKVMRFSMAADSQNNTAGVKYIRFSSGQSPEQGYDLILFNDEKGAKECKKEENENGYRECQKEKTEIHHYFSSYSGQEAICFYFGPKHISTPENIQLSYANARLQLYGNLMNALRFREFMV